jgi:hypothetical protein
MQSVVGKVDEAKRIFYGFAEDRLGRGERITEMENKWSEWKSWETNNKNNAEVWQSWQSDLDGKWAAYAAADSLCQEIDSKRGISLLQDRFIKRHESSAFPAASLNSALTLKRVAQFIRIIYHLSKFRKRQNMKSFVLTCAQ